MIRLAIDVGSYVTKIYMLGCGVVLSEATCVAVESSVTDGQTELTIKAYGDRARALSGRAALNTHIVNPVFEGDIKHPKLLAPLLSYFLNKLEISYKKAKKCEVVFILPCGARPQLTEKYRQVAEECGLGRILFTRTPYAAVLGHNVTLTETAPVCSVDIGYGVANIAVFSLDGMISGITVNLGSGNIDVHLMDLVAENFGLKIGSLTAERLKNVVGSLLEDDNKMTVVDGRDIKSGAPSSVAVNSSEIEDVIKLYVDKIAEYVTAVVKKLPAEVASAVMRGGVYVSGGLTEIDGFADYFSDKLGIAVNQCEVPRLAAVIGGGMILASDYLCERLTTLG